MLDLLVIGAGLSGLCAAIAAAEAGLRVRVVTKGLNALHWSAGTLDLLGYAPATGARIEQPLAALRDLPDRHPYVQAGRAGIEDALAWFTAFTAAQGLPYAGAAHGANLWLPSPAGAARPAFLAPAAQRAGDLADPAPLLVVGFDGLRDFYPDLIAANLARQGYAARAHRLPLHLLTRRADANNVQLAQGVEEPGRAATLGNALAHLVRPGERIALPALLGLTRHAQVLDTLARTAGAPICEIPTLPPSVPGIRLHTALVARVQALGGRVEPNMAAVAFGVERSRIAWVETASSARPLRHHAAAYLLATGGILGGGLAGDHTGRLWETVFGLPLTGVPPREAWFHHEFLTPGGQPVFRVGVATNAEFQPVGADGELLYENLWAAGSTLAHADGLAERSREGIALVSGWVAARALAHHRTAVPA